jgi:hypothetical protein
MALKFWVDEITSQTFSSGLMVSSNFGSVLNYSTSSFSVSEWRRLKGASAIKSAG